MRFLTIVYGLGPGGTERVAQNYSEGYKLLGHDVLVFSHDSGGPRVKELLHNNINVSVGGGEGDKKTYDIIDKIVSWDPHVVHIHSHGANENIIRYLFSKFQKKPFVIETNVFSKPSAWLDLIDISFLFGSRYGN